MIQKLNCWNDGLTNKGTKVNASKTNIMTEEDMTSVVVTRVVEKAVVCQYLYIPNNFSVCGHVNNIIASSAQTVYALRLLRSHGTACL